MARSLNKVQLIGNLGADPELRHTASGVPVVSFSLATNWSRTNESGTTEENTEWHNIVAWRRLAEICQQYLSKGSKVYLEGRIQTRSWDDEQGNKRYMTEVKARDMMMLDGREDGGGGYDQSRPQQRSQQRPQQSGGGQAKPQQGRRPDAQYEPDDTFEPDDDLPF